MPLDHTTKSPKGIAFVRFAKPSHAIDAFEKLDKSAFQGRLLHILPALDRSGSKQAGVGDNKTTLKEENEKKRKAAAGKEFNWSMLYMNVRIYHLPSFCTFDTSSL